MNQEPQIIEPKKKRIALIIIGFIAGILACAMFWSLKDGSTLSTPSVDMTTWQTYRNEEYGFEFEYPVDLTVVNKGPNEAQKKIVDGETISGTVQPSLETLSFVNIYSNNEMYDLIVFPPRNIGSPVAPEDFFDGYLEGSVCDRRWITTPDSFRFTRLSNENGIDFLRLSIGDYLCYYLKNQSDNLIVLSKRSADDVDPYLKDIMLSFKFFEPTIPKIDSKYKQVELKDVIKYAGTGGNNYVETSGIVAGIKLSPGSLYGYSLLLKDNEDNYLLVPLGKFEAKKFGDFYSKLKLGDRVIVKGIASFTEPAPIELEKKFNLSIKLPKQIGMLSLDDINLVPDTSTRKTYRNGEYKYEFKYPSDWEVAITYFSSADGSQQWPSGFKISPIELASTSKDFISIGGGKGNIYPLTYTFSSESNILKTFDLLISSFKFI